MALATASDASERSAATTLAAPRYFAAATTSDPIGPAPLTSTSRPRTSPARLHRVQRDGERLGERSVLGAHALGQRADLVGAHDPQLAEPAVGVRVERRRAEVADPRVEVGAAGDPLGQAPVADQLGRVDGDRVPDLGPVTPAPTAAIRPATSCPSTSGCVSTAVPEAPWRQYARSDPQIPPHSIAIEHLAGAGHRVGPLVDPQVAGSVDDDGLHAASSSRTRSRPRVSGASAADTRVISE